MVCDEQLVRQSLAGNEDAFRQIVENYEAYVFAIILNFVKDPSEAENIAQETFFQAYRSLPQYRFHNFKGWLGRIAVNKSMDWKRLQMRRAREHPFYEYESLSAFARNGGIDESDPEKLLLAIEEKAKARKAYNSLPELYRRTVRKYYIEKKNYRQIALEEGTTAKTIESRLYRARNMMREIWREGEQ